MTVTTIPTAGIADDAVGNTKLDLSANYAFTGTVTGTPQVFVQITKTTLSGTATAWNPIFTSDYDNYMVQFDNVGSTATGTQVFFKFYNETGATSDNIYRGRTQIIDSNGTDRSQNYQNSYPKLTSNMDGNSTGTGMNLSLFIYQPLNATVMTQYSYIGSYGRTDGYMAYILGGGGTTDYATREHTGLYIYNEGGGSFTGRSQLTLYGIKRT